MTPDLPPLDGPKRSQPGPRPNPGAPRRAAIGDDEPIMSGYTYQPTEVIPPAPNPEAFQPITATPPVADSIDNYKPKTPLNWWLIVAGVLIIAIIGSLVINALPAPTSPTTAPPPRPTLPTPTRTGGVGYDNGTVAGYWRITETTWVDNRVTLAVEIVADSGTLYFDFY
ncbi:MAG: hypothetical protein LBE83_04290, partial [Propionibacteriaceae bacterium]|nr:hypothetical protein [Propionibacteriaceae bacterium]